MTEKVWLSWSGGKDSALALQALIEDARFAVEGLLTTITAGYERISMHGVRVDLLEHQAKSLQLPLKKVIIPQECPDETYNRLMRETLEELLPQGISGIAFGDLHLEDIRRYREDRLAEVGLQGVFPLWGWEPTAAAHSFLDQGYKALLVCVDTELLDGTFVGRDYDRTLLDDLPQNVDPCGERGAFHTFVYDGPIYQNPVRLKKGEKVLREGRFYFCDLLLESTQT